MGRYTYFMMSFPSVGLTCFGEFLICINGNLLKQYNVIVAVWISLGFVTFAGYASCIKYHFVGMYRLSLKECFIVLMLNTCRSTWVTSTVLILVCHCLWLMILFLENLVIFVVYNVLVSFLNIFLCGMIRFLKSVFIPSVSVSMLYCLSLWRINVRSRVCLNDELCQVADAEARQRLRSSSSSSLIVSRTRLSTVGDRAFPVAAAPVWNSLPDLVTSAPSIAVFRSRLKTHLFNISYPSPLWLTVQCPRNDA